MFLDIDGSLGAGGSVVGTLGTDHWVLHMDDPASICCDDDDDELVVEVRVLAEGTAGEDSSASVDTTAAPMSHGSALRVSGAGHVAIGDSPSLYLDQSFTIELWFHMERLIPGTTFGWNQLLANNEYEIAIAAGDGRIATCCYDGRSLTSLLEDQTQIEGRRWYHLALIHDGNSQRILLDGELDRTVGTVKPHGDRQMDLWLGDDPDADRPFDGYIDEVRIWDRPLDVEEVRAYRNRVRAGTEEDLVGYWSFEGLDAGGLVRDLSGHGNDGRLVGDAALVSVPGSDGGPPSR